jgi:ornithine--oxo-acid transaminase
VVRSQLLSKDTHDTVVRFAPPLTVSAAQIDEAVRAFGRALAAVEAGQRGPGRKAA